jgi:hypothetical protein
MYFCNLPNPSAQKKYQKQKSISRGKARLVSEAGNITAICEPVLHSLLWA